MTKKIQSIPEARLLLESLRSVGYNEETAIADIIDNCISAKAHEIKIQFDWEKKRIVISDDGLGMSSKDLIENMRIGSSDPNQVRDERDLGRFGMGMKTAAFSLGKKLTVVTKSNSTVSNASWDLEQIPSIGWNLIIRDESEISEFSSQIDEQGTVVIIENLDRVIDTDDEKKAKNKFYRIANRTEKHLALTFHRFIEEDCLILELNDIPIKAWNPFIVENSATQELPEESVFSDNGCIKAIIQPYVLPHKTKFASDDDYQLAGGPKGWNYHQGIYVYRNKRLIICGTWFDYIKKEPAYNLARIKIDISSASDEDFLYAIKGCRITTEQYQKTHNRKAPGEHIFYQGVSAHDVANFLESYETSKTATRANSKYMADYIRTMNADGIGGVKSWTVCLINVSGHGENFDIADLKNIGGGIYREEGHGVDSYADAAICSIHAMTSAGHEYLDYDKQAYDKVLQLREKYKNDSATTKVNEIIRRETRAFSNGLLILYPIGDAGQLTALKGNHKPPFGFAAVFPDRNGKGNLKSYRMNDIALEKDNDELYG